MYIYLSKDDDEFSQAIKQVFKEAKENEAGYYDQMKSMAYSYASKQECSL